MSEPQGPNIAEWQAAQQHQESSGEKSGFGQGLSDFIATLPDGGKWLFTCFEGGFASYSNVISGLLDSGVLLTMLGKSSNMFGLKFLEGLADYLTGGGGGDEGAPQGDDGYHQEHDGLTGPDGYPHFNNEHEGDFRGFGEGAHHDGDHHGGQDFSPTPSPYVGDDHGHERG